MKTKMTLSEIRTLAMSYGIDYNRTKLKSIKSDIEYGNAWYENNPNWSKFITEVKKYL